MPSGRYLAGFDALRASAVIIVMVYHVNKNVPDLHLFSVFRHGYLGVDLSFVLSGFLITGILLRTRSRNHFFRNFYARRFLRIWPLYFAILLWTLVLLPIARPAYKDHCDQLPSADRLPSIYAEFVSLPRHWPGSGYLGTCD